jgi:phosphate-selective porin OprO/OprP
MLDTEPSTDPSRRRRAAARRALLAAGLFAATPAALSQAHADDTPVWWRGVDLSVPMLLGDWHVYTRDGLHFDHSRHGAKLLLTGTLFGDVGHFDQNSALYAAFPDDSGWHAALTRARLTLRGWQPQVGNYKLQMEFAERVQVKDAWFAFDPLPYVGTVQLGNMKEPYSLNNLSSGTDDTFMTVALPVEAFAPGRNLGVMARDTALDARMTWALGGFWNTESFSNFSGAKDALSNAIGFNITGRVTALPLYEAGGSELMHLGLSLSLQRFTADVQVRATVESRLVSDYYIDTGPFAPSGGTQLALEFARVSGPWSVQAEAYADAIRGDGLGSPLLRGFYVFASHALTGESRPYDRAAGVFGGIVPKRNFSWHDGGWGALELAARLSHANLNSGSLAGGKQTDLTLGLNWTLNPNSRVMLNYIYGVVNERAYAPAIDKGRVSLLQARLQLDF